MAPSAVQPQVAALPAAYDASNAGGAGSRDVGSAAPRDFHGAGAGLAVACKPKQALIDRAERYRALNDRPPGYARNWREVLAYFGVRDDVPPVTREQLVTRVGRWGGWRPFLVEFDRLEACGWEPPTTGPTPEEDTTTPVPVPQAAGTAHFVGGQPLGYGFARGATATSTPVTATMGEDDHYGVSFQVARSGSNEVCLDGVERWRQDDVNFRFQNLESDDCIAESAWESGRATVTGHGAAVDNNIVDPDRILTLSIRATSATSPRGGPFQLTLINDDHLWIFGRVERGRAQARVYREAGETYIVRATAEGPGWGANAGESDAVFIPVGTSYETLDLSGIMAHPRNCSLGAARVVFSLELHPSSLLRMEHLKLYDSRHNLC